LQEQRFVVFVEKIAVIQGFARYSANHSAHKDIKLIFTRPFNIAATRLQRGAKKILIEISSPTLL